MSSVSDAYTTISYQVRNAIARITLNRPERLNAINRAMTAELGDAVARANADDTVRVLVLRGAGRAFCAGYDLAWGTEAEARAQRETAGIWDPVRDYIGMSRNVAAFVALWESYKPVICGIHGWCVGGGTDLALCADLIIAAEDARIGYPPARIWGTPTTVMWVYRLPLEHAKRLMLTGDAVDGVEAARIGLVSKAVPADRLDAEVEALATRLASIPANQLALSKLLVNQAYENMGLRTSQLIGTVFDGIARHTPEGIAWRELAIREGFKEAVRRRDAPHGDYRYGRPGPPPGTSA
ncbi:MAG: enoyl-CoA hydratase [Chloroflexota bacterium]